MDIHLKKAYEIHVGQGIDQQRLLDAIAAELGARGIRRDSYRLGDDPHIGFGELRLSEEDGYWVVCVDERGASFNACIFTDYFDAVKFFIFELSGASAEPIWKKF
ncbi:hypothetical protein [Caballeronia sp. ATUFL_F1_KS4A]|uniref:hypothetical protein n=1 Tax=Caballeronia sp. ATUFL_F1_KS4A TaxID=2921768 RepID=UPI002027ABE2|nr:hypothetical protein [Caballeronia sp. ATUFL_F1_KS4A]